MGQEHALQHRSPDLGLGGERHIVRNAGVSAARAIIGPGLGQVERAVDQRPAMAARCVVPESRGALSRDEEDALWQEFYTAAPAQRREFEPSSKRRKRRPASLPPATG